MAVVASAKENERVRDGIDTSAWMVPFCSSEVVMVLAVRAYGSSPDGWGVHAIWQDGSRGKGPSALVLP